MTSLAVEPEAAWPGVIQMSDWCVNESAEGKLSGSIRTIVSFNGRHLMPLGAAKKRLETFTLTVNRAASHGLNNQAGQLTRRSFFSWGEKTSSRRLRQIMLSRLAH